MRDTFQNKKALLLDMNSTFMFGEDRFGESEDFSLYYHAIGGTLSQEVVMRIIRDAYAYLDERYPQEGFRESFPTLAEAIVATTSVELSETDMVKIIDTFAYHELGYIPEAYVDVLFKLSEHFTLSVVIDIWAPKNCWVETFEKHGIDKLFVASSFSSDYGMVKPSPKPFELVVEQLGVSKEACLVIGDSVRRDLGGAKAAGIDCVLLGGVSDDGAVACYPNLLAFYEDVI